MTLAAPLATAPDAALVAKVRSTYEAAGQGHVFTFFDKLSPSEQASFIAQLAEIDISRVNNIFSRAIEASKTEPTEEVLPLPQEACASILNNPKDEARWREIGLKAIADNTVGVLLMAGGQGTRLGSRLPKGMYDIKLPSGLTLFEYQAARIKRLEKVAAEFSGKKDDEVIIKWYVMTSGPTKQQTIGYFESKDWFGLRKENVVFFEQGVLPAMSNDGKLLLSTPSSLSVAPDGNGGLYSALRRPLSPSDSRTVLSDIHSSGIKYIHGYCVDNCLVKVADPVFIGCCIEREAGCGAKVVRKLFPTELVGVLAKRGSAFSVVEYSEIPKEKAELRDPSGELTFRAGNIANHFYTSTFLDSVEAMEPHMAFHIARKKIPTIDLQTGESFTPTSPNGMKLEMFVFDVFPFTKSLCVLEVDRAEEFSPLKNAPGSAADCPETSRRDLLAQQKRWLIENGATVDEGVEVEVTPMATYAGEGLEWVRGERFIKSGVIYSQNDATKLTA